MNWGWKGEDTEAERSFNSYARVREEGKPKGAHEFLVEIHGRSFQDTLFFARQTGTNNCVLNTVELCTASGNVNVPEQR